MQPYTAASIVAVYDPWRKLVRPASIHLVKVVPVLLISSTLFFDTIATYAKGVFSKGHFAAPYRCCRTSFACCVMLALLLTTSGSSRAETPAGSTLTNQQRQSVRSLLKQVDLTYRFEQFEREARVRAIEEVVRNWSHSTQTQEDAKKLETWLGEAKKKTVPGLVSPLPKRPIFSSWKKKTQTTAAQPSSVKQPQEKPAVVAQTKPLAAQPIDEGKLSQTTQPKINSQHVVKKPISQTPSELLNKSIPLPQLNEPSKITTSEKTRKQTKPLPSRLDFEAKVVVPSVAEALRKNAALLPATPKPVAEIPTRLSAAHPIKKNTNTGLGTTTSQTKLSKAFTKRFPSANQHTPNRSISTERNSVAQGVGRIDYKELAAQINGFRQGVRQIEAMLVTKNLRSIEQLQTISSDLSDLKAQRELLAIYLQATGRSHAEITKRLSTTAQAKSMLLRAVKKRIRNWEATANSRRIREQKRGLEALKKITRKHTAAQTNANSFPAGNKHGGK